ncbi:MAG: hypothetical protein K9J30_05205 [Bacteroidales bacterium]|nr:hypothetical protein [Bacteroidales bacterium]
MGKKIIIPGILIITLALVGVSCGETEDIIEVKNIESQVFNEIDKFRVDNGIPDSDPFVHQLVMIKEAQLFSAKMAVTTLGLDTTGIAVHWDMIHSKIGGTNDATLLQSTTATTAQEIVSNWTSETVSREILLGDYSQCGVGIEYSGDNIAYVTVLMMLVE